VPALIGALKDKEAWVRLNAVWALEEVGPPAKPAVAPLMECLTDKEAFVRRASAKALKKIDLGAAKRAGVP
jgi:HEAT repeat protein